MNHPIRRLLPVVSAILLLSLSACKKDNSSTPDLISCDDATIVAGQLATLSCKAETTAALSAVWKVTDLSGIEQSIDSNGLTMTFTAAKVQQYRATVTASDGSDSETETFLVTATNPSPTVDCPATVSVKAGRPVTIDCSSSDFAGEALRYSWTITPPPSVAVTPVNSAVEDVTFTPPVAGAYALLLTVSNSTSSVEKSVSVNVAAAAPWKIMPIGDSITQSNLEHQSYRYQLWAKMLNANISFDFIGSQQLNSNQTAVGNLPPGTVQVARPDITVNGQTYTFDPDHEAYWGLATDEVLTRLRASLPALAEKPDIALIHLGTNDVRNGQSDASTIQELKSIIAELRNSNPEVIIMVAKIIPYATNTGAVTPLNLLIDDLDTSMSQGNSPVIIVDQYSGFNPVSGQDTFDGIHPNLSGEGKLADKWLAAIRNVVK
jgi:hypothetical protein